MHTHTTYMQQQYLSTSYREIGEDTIFFIFVARVDFEALNITVHNDIIIMNHVISYLGLVVVPQL